MAVKNVQKVSVVIPIYNDEKYIKSCLKAVFNQTIKPYEVIVVDNNCTDESINIARQFNKVKIIKEPKQGLSFARQTGFNKAKGNYLLRLDVDTILPCNYIQSILMNFSKQDIAGVTAYGISRFESVPGTSKIWSWCYFAYTESYFGYKMLWGSNMIIKRDYWHKINNLLINNDFETHEDQDISLALASVGGKIIQVKKPAVSVQMEGVQHFTKYNYYVKMMRNLKKLDKKHKRSKFKRRLKKTSLLKRILLWVLSAWSLYVFYIITIFYSTYWNINYWLRSH